MEPMSNERVYVRGWDGTRVYPMTWLRACVIDEMPWLRWKDFEIWEQTLRIWENGGTEVVDGEVVVELDGSVSLITISIFQEIAWIETMIVSLYGEPKKTLLEVLDAQVKPWEIVAPLSKSEIYDIVDNDGWETVLDGNDAERRLERWTVTERPGDEFEIRGKK